MPTKHWPKNEMETTMLGQIAVPQQTQPTLHAGRKPEFGKLTGATIQYLKDGLLEHYQDV